MRLWVTRTEPGAERTAGAIAALGHEPVIQPALTVQTLDPPGFSFKGYAAIAFTSGQAVTAACRLSADRQPPVFATGAGTQAAALEAGFADVRSAEGDAEALAGLIRASSPAGPVLWPCAAEPARDLAALLAERGIACVAVPVYRTVPSLAPPPPGLDGVVIHSARAAEAVARVLSPEQARTLALFALSEAATAPLKSLPFARVAVASRPQESVLIALIAG